MNYSIDWIDATLTEHFKDEQDFINSSKENGIEVSSIQNSGDWYDFSARHKFEAQNDKEAIDYCNNYVENDERIEVFSLLKQDKIIYTEEDMGVNKK